MYVTKIISNWRISVQVKGFLKSDVSDEKMEDCLKKENKEVGEKLRDTFWQREH